MKGNYKKSLLGGVLAFILGTSCCWLTSVAIWLGGATFLSVISRFSHKYNAIILGIALLFFAIAIYQFLKHKKKKSNNKTSIIILALLSSFPVFSQKGINPANEIIGKWKTQDNRGIIEIFKQKEKYQGKIIWLKNATNKDGHNRKDVENPSKNKRNVLLIGLTIMNSFELKNNEFVNGTIYDPDTGITYDCKLWLTNNNTLMVRDYCGIFYKTFTWIKKKWKLYII